jgi:hypothetical protein
MKYLILTLIFLTAGCGTIRNAIMPPIPTLKEGEIPYQLKPGVYEDTHGEKYLVASNVPRWSVSEAYIFDTVSNAKPVEPEKWYKKFLNYFLLGAGGMFGLVLAFIIGKLIKR